MLYPEQLPRTLIVKKYETRLATNATRQSLTAGSQKSRLTIGDGQPTKFSV